MLGTVVSLANRVLLGSGVNKILMATSEISRVLVKVKHLRTRLV